MLSKEHLLEISHAWKHREKYPTLHSKDRTLLVNLTLTLSRWIRDLSHFMLCQRVESHFENVHTNKLQIVNCGRSEFKFIFIGVTVARVILMNEGIHICSQHTPLMLQKRLRDISVQRPFLFFQIDPSVWLKLTEWQTVSDPTSRSISNSLNCF